MKDLISREKARDEILSLMKDMKLIVGDTTVWQDVIILPNDSTESNWWRICDVWRTGIYENEYCACGEREKE